MIKETKETKGDNFLSHNHYEVLISPHMYNLFFYGRMGIKRQFKNLNPNVYQRGKLIRITAVKIFIVKSQGYVYGGVAHLCMCTRELI